MGKHTTRFALSFLLALAILAIPATAEPWGCCLPAAGACFDSGLYTDRNEFRDDCTAASGIILGDGTATTCSSFSQCDMGCCCAGADVPGASQINSDESLLYTSRSSCDAKTGGTWTFNIPQGGSTCVQTCGGTGTQPPGGAYDVSGIVRNATSSQPLANVSVFIPIPAGDISDVTGADGTYTLVDVPRMTTRVFAVHPACRPGQSQVVAVIQDLTNVAIGLDCASSGCTHQRPALTPPRVVVGTDEVETSITFQDTCGDLVHYEPLRCDEDFENCIALAPQVSAAIRDSGLEPRTTYCYRVRSRFADGTYTESTGTPCVMTGDAACMGRDPDDPESWCGETLNEPIRAAILSCDQNNRIDAEACTATQACSTASGTPRCVEPPACSLCNGLAGLFAHLDLEIVDGAFTRACSEVCVLDRQYAGSPSMVDAYSSCLAYSSCEQYRNEEACDDDLCGVGVTDACAWTSVSDELGVGVCASDARPACDQCDDLFGTCSKDLCEAISPDCYYDAEKNGLAQALGCLSAQQMSCRRYDNQADCNGGVNAEYDILRTDAGDYDGGTHERTTDSEDRLAFGACDWLGARCIKDADEAVEDGEDDCIENGRFYDDPDCLSDSTPPNTTVHLTSPPIYSRLAIRSLPFSVRDDRSPIDTIETFFCIGNASCLPTDTLGTIALPEIGQHSLRFFSIDASGNYEPVKTLTIIVRDSSEPGIEDVALEEDG